MQSSPLFAGMNSSEIQHLMNLAHKQRKNYKKDEIVVHAGDETVHLYIVLSGSVRGEMNDYEGKVIKIEDVRPPGQLAIGFLFAAKPCYPVQVTANEPTELLGLSKDSVVLLLQQNRKFLTNFLRVVSNKQVFLTQKIRLLGFSSIKEKLVHFLLTECERQKSDTITLAQNQNQIADLFGVTRPALARSIRQLHDSQIINAQGKLIELRDKHALNSLLKKHNLKI